MAPGQWKIRELSVYNWGGFDGKHIIDFDKGTTLITGMSGAGKSTLLDAWTVLMMPASVHLNAASNKGRARARSAGNRTFLTYARGVLDSIEDDRGNLKEIRLPRGSGACVSVIAASFEHTDGRTISAVRCFFVPSSATEPANCIERMGLVSGELELDSLIALGKDKFPLKELRALGGNWDWFDSPTGFRSSLYTRLGIGAEGLGDRAMDLHRIIQSGTRITNVNDLFVNLVLEKPSAFAKAAEVVEAFEAVRGQYEEMETASAKIAVLDGIEELHDKAAAARAEAARIDTYGVTRPGSSIFSAWASQVRDEKYADAESEARAAATELSKRLEQAKHEGTALTRKLNDLRQLQRAGGGDVERLEIAISETQEALETVRRRAQASPLDVSSFEAFLAAQKVEQEFLDSFDAARSNRVEDLTRARSAAGAVEAREQQLRAEIGRARTSRGNIPQQLTQARDMLADKLGVPHTQLPFFGELVDILDFEWSVAANVLLAPAATSMLVSPDLVGDLRHQVERINWRETSLGSRAIRYEVVDTSADASFDSGTIGSKLQFADHPFAGHVRNEIARRFPHQATDDVDAAPPLVTRRGQVKDRGGRGQFGGAGRAPLLGFSSAGQVEHLNAQLEALRPRLVETRDALAQAQAALDELTARRARAESALSLNWSDVDVQGVAARLEEQRSQLESTLKADSSSADLAASIQEAADNLRAHDLETARLQAAADQANAAWEKWVDRRDALVDAMEEVEVEDLAKADLDEALSHEGDLTPSNIDDALDRVRSRLRAKVDEVDQYAGALEDAVLGKMRAYYSRWPNDNRSVSLESYPDYLADYTDLVEQGLPAAQEAFRKHMTELTARHVASLAATIRSDKSSIIDRLEAVNGILSEIPFGAKRGHLQIHTSDYLDVDTRQFLRQLRDLASRKGIISGTEDDPSSAYRSYEKFIELLEGGTAKVLDVRRHLSFSAEAVDDDGNRLATYTSFAGKSGGETQELTTFIIGAALRYQLGQTGSQWPVFAPVFIDEAFVKADPEHMGRALEAWASMGFQLIVAAPVEKVSASLPHVGASIGIAKSPSGYSSASNVRHGQMVQA